MRACLPRETHRLVKEGREAEDIACRELERGVTGEFEAEYARNGARALLEGTLPLSCARTPNSLPQIGKCREKLVNP